MKKKNTKPTPAPTPTPPPATRIPEKENPKTFWTWIIGLLVITIFIYFPALTHELVNWDDDSYIIQNTLIQSFSLEAIIHLFSSFYTGNYHPLTLLTYAIEYQLVQAEPLLYHLDNLLLHLGNTLLVFFFFRRFTQNITIGGITALLFAIHPLHVESVAWAAERKDVLYTFFFLGAMYFYESWQENRKPIYYSAILLCFLLSCLSKGMAVVLPAALVTLDFLKGRNILNLKTLIIEKAPIWLMALAFGIIAIIAQEKAIRDEKIFSHLDNIFIGGYGYLQYLWKTVVPIQLSCFYPYPQKTQGLMPWYYYASILSLPLTAGIAWKLRKTHPWITGGWLFFLVTIVMVLQFLPVGAAVYADRYYYLASVGLFYIVAEAFTRIPNSKTQLYSIAGILIVIVYSGLSFQRVKVWENSLTLFSNVIDQYPNASFAYNNIGTYYQNKKEPEKSISWYEKCTQSNPQYDLGFINLTIAYNAIKNFDKAVLSGRRGVELNPNSYDGWASLAFAYDNLKDYAQAAKAYEAAHRLKPEDEIIRLNMANAWRNAGQFEPALQLYQQMLKEKADQPDVLNNLGYTLAQLKRFEEAEQLLLKAQAIKPDLIPIYNNLGYTYAMQGRFADAIKIMEKAIEINPKNPESYNNLGNAYGMQGNNDLAIKYFELSLAADPKFSDAQNNLGIAYLNVKNNDKAVYHFREAAKLGNPNARQFLKNQNINW